MTSDRKPDPTPDPYPDESDVMSWPAKIGVFVGVVAGTILIGLEILNRLE